jgi:hypothetical protein
MDNEGLLKWSEHKAKRARVILDMAEAEMQIRRETVRIEKENKQQMTDCEAYLEKLEVPVIIYKMARSLEELLVIMMAINDNRKCEVIEKELES